MIIVTNLPAISEAFDGAAPRSVDEVMLEHYPDATVDRWGRAHAPHDGYSDPDGNVYRGGEYLPEPPEFDEMKQLQRMMNGRRRPALKVYHDGQVHVFEGTPGQVKAAREVAKAQMVDFDQSRDFIGAEKRRDVFDLTIFAVFANVTEWGLTYTHYMRDAELNPVVYRGSKQIGKEGDTVHAKFTVKSHWQSPDGTRRATYVNRPALIA
jgi:hypothetical protein